MNFLLALSICMLLQAASFYPFYLAWKQDKEKYGSDLGVPLRKRFLVWLVICPVWALPFAALAGGAN